MPKRPGPAGATRVAGIAPLPRVRGGIVLLLLFCTGLFAANVPAQPAAVPIRISAQPLADALILLAEQTSLQIFYSPEDVAGYRVAPLYGRFTADEALQALLRDTPFLFRRVGRNVTLSRTGPLGQLPPIQVVGAPQASTGPVAGYVAARSAAGTRTDTPLIETPQSLSVVTASQIRTTGAQSLAEALAYTAGVTSVASATNDAPSIRGFAASRVNGSFYLDGTRISMEGFSDRFDMYAYERAEVLKGAASVLYGASEPGGILNLVSKRPSPDAVRELNLSYGSHDRRQLSFDIGGSLDDYGAWGWRLTGLARESGTFREHVPDDRLFLAPALTWRPGAATSLTLLAQYQRSSSAGTIALPARGTVLANPNGRLARSRFPGEPGDYYRPRTRSLGYLFEHAFNGRVTVRNSLRYHAFDQDFADSSAFSSRYVAPADYRLLARQRLDRRDEASAVTADASLEYRVQTGPVAHVVLLGADHAYQKWRMARDYYRIAPLDLYAPVYGAEPGPRLARSGWLQHSRKTGLYMQDQMKLHERWVATIGARQDWVDSDEAGSTSSGAILGSDTRDSAFTGRIGLVYLADSGLAPFAGFSQSFHPAGGTDRAGNTFRPATGEQYEIGLRYQPPGRELLLSGAVYRLTQDNVLTPDPASPGYSLQVGQVRSHGFELEVRGRLTDALSVLFAYTYTDARVRRSSDAAAQGRRVPAIPRNQAALWLDYRLDHLGVPGLTAGVGIRHVGGTPASLPVDGAVRRVDVPAYTVVDLGLALERGPWRYALNVANVGDRRYVENGAGLVAWGEPRRAVLTASYRW